MALIATTQYNKGKIHGVIMHCTEEEYQRYLMTGDINEYSFSAAFLKKYLQDNGCKIGDVEELSQKVGTEGEKGTMIMWMYARIFSVDDAKAILGKYDLDYHTFVDSYAEHLKYL